MDRLLSLTTIIASLMWSALATAAPGVRIGLCAGPDKLEAAKAAGFDYVELPVREIAAMSDEAFAKLVDDRKRIGLPTPVGNVFLPGDLKVTGPDADPAKQDAYVANALGRAKQLGLKIVVFGSGAARKVPDGLSRDEAWKQLVDFGKRAARAAQKNGITLAVEPLRKQESNIINTAAEGWELVKAVRHPHFQLMVDLYHLTSENEDPSIITKAGKAIRHFHIANPEGRVYPLSATEFDYAPFFAAVKSIRYRGGISVEGSSKAFDVDAPKAVDFLRKAVAGKLGATTAESR